MSRRLNRLIGPTTITISLACNCVLLMLLYKWCYLLPRMGTVGYTISSFGAPPESNWTEDVPVVHPGSPYDHWRPKVPGSASTCTYDQCSLPDCYCAGTTGPAHMPLKDIPQMVMLTFDDAINQDIAKFHHRLFMSKRRVNPNTCSISTTFYVTGVGTNYDLVRTLHKAGHEVALHSKTHKMPETWWAEADMEDWNSEIMGQRQDIVQAGIPLEEIRGVRAPYLETGGDKLFIVASDIGLTFDSSFWTTPHDEGGVWPFTLDHKPDAKYCGRCPLSTYSGLWELPINSWVSPAGEPCSAVDFCGTEPMDKIEALAWMWYNFNRFYKRNRAPLGITLHGQTFIRNIVYLEALELFLDGLAALDDVYLVSASQVIAWMRQPTALEHIKDFKPWHTKCEQDKIARTLGS